MKKKVGHSSFVLPKYTATTSRVEKKVLPSTTKSLKKKKCRKQPPAEVTPESPPKKLKVHHKKAPRPALYAAAVSSTQEKSAPVRLKAKKHEIKKEVVTENAPSALPTKVYRYDPSMIRVEEEDDDVPLDDEVFYLDDKQVKSDDSLQEDEQEPVDPRMECFAIVKEIMNNDSKSNSLADEKPLTNNAVSSARLQALKGRLAELSKAYAPLLGSTFFVGTSLHANKKEESPSELPRCDDSPLSSHYPVPKEVESMATKHSTVKQQDDGGQGGELGFAKFEGKWYPALVVSLFDTSKKVGRMFMKQRGMAAKVSSEYGLFSMVANYVSALTILSGISLGRM